MTPRSHHNRKTPPLRPIAPATGATGLWVITPDRPEGYERLSFRRPDLMVPVNGTRTLTMRTPGQAPVEIINADDGGLFRDFMDRPCCRARVVNNKLLVVDGLLSGRITIELRQGAAQLDIAVTIKDALEVPLIAHYVQQGPLTKTKMTPAMLRAMIAGANDILRPEANVTITLREERTLTRAEIGKSLGRVVTEIPNNTDDEWSLVTKHAVRDPSARRLLNLFLVRRFETEDDDPLNDLAATGDGCCLFEDQIRGGSLDSDAGSTLAHEVGHHLGLDHVEDRRFLMYKARPHGNRLSRSEGDRINLSGVTINPFSP
ncbi:MAG TPA: matrixin family metalloprotease [Candidatus Acidoferrum sp.]|nr:matrixin family metalloprotease [Candidatus Acidoferrum sp.]